MRKCRETRQQLLFHLTGRESSEVSKSISSLGATMSQFPVRSQIPRASAFASAVTGALRPLPADGLFSAFRLAPGTPYWSFQELRPPAPPHSPRIWTNSPPPPCFFTVPEPALTPTPNPIPTPG